MLMDMVNKRTRNQNQFNLKKMQQYQPSMIYENKSSKLDQLWRVLFVIVSIVTIYISLKVYRIQTSLLYKGTMKGDLFEILLYGLPIALVFCILNDKIHKFCDPLCDKYVVNHAKFPDSTIRKAKCFTLVKMGQALIYYCISSIAAYILLYHTDVLPLWLAGNGSCANIMKDHPFMNIDPYWLNWMKCFYIVQFGKHFSKTVIHIFIQAQGKYYEFALHHAVSTYLIVLSYLMNFWLFGVVVLLFHDASDFFLTLARFYRQVRNRKQYILHTFYVLALISWIGFRVFGFTSCCIYPAYSLCTYKNYMDNFTHPMPWQIAMYYYDQQINIGYFLIIMMVLLFVLSLYWTFYIVKSFVATCVSQKITTHTYD